MNDFSPATRKIVAISFLLILVSLMFRSLIHPLYQWCLESVETRRDMYFELERAHSAADEGRKISAQSISELEGRVVGSLMPGANDAEATTQLQALLDGLVKEHGLVIESIQSVAPQINGNGVRVGVDVRASGGEMGVAKLVLGVESRQPLLRIGRLHIRNQNWIGQVPHGHEPRAQIEMSVHAFMPLRKSASQ
ncbi:MAG: hypothetical protein HGB17_02315 [Syntrophobacteraceae bacterium]|nr:hypothetical protein [Syntrophobacteraceae bacterium]